MLGPCDQCVRRQAIHTWRGTESGRDKTLRLCEACFHDQRHKRPIQESPPVARKVLDHERSAAEALQSNLFPHPGPR